MRGPRIKTVGFGDHRTNHASGARTCYHQPGQRVSRGGGGSNNSSSSSDGVGGSSGGVAAQDAHDDDSATGGIVADAAPFLSATASAATSAAVAGLVQLGSDFFVPSAVRRCVMRPTWCPRTTMTPTGNLRPALQVIQLLRPLQRPNGRRPYRHLRLPPLLQSARPHHRASTRNTVACARACYNRCRSRLLCDH